jgi:xanthine dehydrogenase YagT iron-sulfur-binding subunit
MSGGAAGAALATRVTGLPLSTIQEAAGAPPVLSKKAISFTLNGRAVSLEVEPRETLLEALRGRLGMTGPKKVCDRGECGGCTVHIDGRIVYSCMFLAIRAHGKKVVTVEGLARGDSLHPVQQAFIEKDGYQCGYCTPGMIMASVALLERSPSPTPSEIRAGLSGNLCRCGNYIKIYESIEAASKKMRKA